MSYRQPFTGDYPITQGYGVVIPNVTYKNRPHSGIDYGCPTGTPILASNDGIIKYSAYDPTGYGKYIIIQHEDGNATLYGHLSSRAVIENARISQGDIIGYSGQTGYSTGPHLHFEARKQWNSWSSHFDPMTLPLQNFADAVSDEGSGGDATIEPIPQVFEAVEAGVCVVVCDVANVRCHCDMSRVISQLKRGKQIHVDGTVTVYNGLPYRKYYDTEKQCFLMIAEHDPNCQIIMNVDPYGGQD